MSTRSSTPVPAPAAKKQDPLPDKVRRELQGYLAVGAYEKNKCKDLTGKKQWAAIQSSYHGRGDIVGQVEKFMTLKERWYKSCVHREDVHKTGQSSDKLPIVINQRLTRSESVLVLGKNENVNAAILKSTYMTRKGNLSGRTILTMAKSTVREAKKMVTQMSEAVNMNILEIRDGEYYYHSGKNQDDFEHFICFRMYNWKKIYGPSGGPPELNDDDDDNADPAADADEFHNAVSSPMADNNQNNGVIATDEEMQNMPPPPPDYLPKGFFLFMARGPMAPKEDRFDIMDNGMEQKGGSRKQTRAEEKKEKDGARDFDAGTNGGRGMALGGTYKDLAIIAQQKRKLDQNDRATDIARLTAALNSKNTRWKTQIESIKLMREIGEDETAKEMAQELPKLSAEVKALESQLEKVKEDVSTANVDTNAPVELFLQRGSQAMGLKTPDATKNSDNGGVEDLTNDDDESMGGSDDD